MMVAFSYDNGAVGSLYYSREIPSMLKGLRLSKLMGRKGVITFESNGVIVLRARARVAASDLPRLPRHPRLPGDVSRLPECDRHGHGAGDEPRARDRGSAIDGSDLWIPDRRSDLIADVNTIRHHHHWQRRRRRHHGPRARRHRREDPDRRARRFHSPGRSQLESGVGLEGPALPHHRDVARRARPRVPPVHALLRRRQHQVLGHGDVPAAAGGLQGDASTPTASRRRGRSTTTRWRRTTIAPKRMYDVHGQHGIDPTEAPRGPYPFPPVPHSTSRRRRSSIS